jgi:hypothetical protein
MFYCASTDSVDSCPKAEPWEQRGLTLYTLAGRLQKQKARSNPYMVIFNFIGCFILCYMTFPSLVLHDLHHVQICQVLSLCYAIPTSLLLSLDSGLVCFLLILFSATLFPLWCSDPLRVKKYHLNLGACIFIASLQLSPFVIFFPSPVVFPVGLPDKHSIKWHLVSGL